MIYKSNISEWKTEKYGMVLPCFSESLIYHSWNDENRYQTEEDNVRSFLMNSSWNVFCFFHSISLLLSLLKHNQCETFQRMQLCHFNTSIRSKLQWKTKKFKCKPRKIWGVDLDILEQLRNTGENNSALQTLKQIQWHKQLLTNVWR